MLNQKSGESPLNPRAIQMIEKALHPLISSFTCRIVRIKLVVCPHSQMAERTCINTKYGFLRIEPDSFARKGLSYLIEDPGRKGRGFAWVSGYTPDVQQKRTS